MNNKTGIGILVVVIIIILALTLYWQFGPSAVQKAQVIEGVQTTQPQTEQNMIITAMHQYKNGKHIVAGDVAVPTPCHTLSRTVSVSGTTPQQAVIAFVTLAGDDLCAQVVTSARFQMEFNAPEDVVVSATWNGEPVQLNLIPAGPNDDLENFEVYIKG